jgi:hypothetical protein
MQQEPEMGTRVTKSNGTTVTIETTIDRFAEYKEIRKTSPIGCYRIWTTAKINLDLKPIVKCCWLLHRALQGETRCWQYKTSIPHNRQGKTVGLNPGVDSLI